MTATDTRTTWQAGDPEPAVGTAVIRTDGKRVTRTAYGWQGGLNWTGITSLGVAVDDTPVNPTAYQVVDRTDRQAMDQWKAGVLDPAASTEEDDMPATQTADPAEVIAAAVAAADLEAQSAEGWKYAAPTRVAAHAVKALREASLLVEPRAESDLDRADADAVTRVMGLLRQTDMTGDRKALARRIVTAVHLAHSVREEDRVWEVVGCTGGTGSVGDLYSMRNGQWSWKFGDRWVLSSFADQAAMQRSGYTLVEVDPDTVGFDDDPDCRCIRACQCTSYSIDVDRDY